jgi:orotate phosphoribosyltransferase
MTEVLSEAQARQIFMDSHALMNGHFRLSSGRHSDEYWEKFWVLQYPQYVQTLCAEIARRFANDDVEVVLGPTTGGILLAFEVARQMNVRALYAEKEDGERMLRRGLSLAPGTRTLIVDDIMTTGGATRECLELAGKHKAEVVGVAVLVDRSGGSVRLGPRQEALLSVLAQTFAPEECPLCAQGIPIKSPGSSAITSS